MEVKGGVRTGRVGVSGGRCAVACLIASDGSSETRATSNSGFAAQARRPEQVSFHTFILSKSPLTRRQ